MSLQRSLVFIEDDDMFAGMTQPTLIALVALLLYAPSARSEVEQSAIDRAIELVRPALVQIYVVSVNYADGREVKNEGAGSGVIISEDGYVLSNHHVAGHAKRLVCIMPDNEEIEAELAGTDPLSDISVIRLKPSTPRRFPRAEFGDSDAVNVGDPVLAMGSPMALSQSVTLGIVSNTKMVMPRLFWPFNRFTLDGEDVGSIVRWIAHDAAIFGGNSGGPLINLQGQVIGINEISLGLSGAIPGNLARGVADALIRDGKVRRSWIGLGVQPLLKHGGQKRGVLVSGTMEGSPAEAAGFQPGDILLRLDGRDVSARFQEELPLFNRFVAELQVGKEIEAEVLRDGTPLTLKTTTVEREESRPRQREIKSLGITVRDISYMIQKEMKLTTRAGALVTSVRPGGPGGEAKPSLNVRDVITSLGGHAVSNTAALVERTEEIARDHADPRPALLGFTRNNTDLITVVKVGRKDVEDPGLEVKKAWLPAGVQVITRDLADQLGQPDLGGARVTQVYPNSTAERVGLKVGDLIVAVDGQSLEMYQSEDYEVLPALMRQYAVGAKPDFTLLREGAKTNLTIELVRAPKLEREMKSYRDELFETTVRETTFFDRVREEWKPEDRGVLVTEVVPGGWAAIGHLAVDDLVMAVDGGPVEDVESFKTAMSRVTKDKPRTVVLSVLRGIHRLYLELEPDWAEEGTGGAPDDHEQTASGL
jgi:serine protease Do